jgi:hypothetical protein
MYDDVVCRSLQSFYKNLGTVEEVEASRQGLYVAEGGVATNQVPGSVIDIAALRECGQYAAHCREVTTHLDYEVVGAGGVCCHSPCR